MNESYFAQDLEVSARDELRNSTDLTLLAYTIKSTITNYGASLAKVQQTYLFPDGVELKEYSLDKGASRTSRLFKESSVLAIEDARMMRRIMEMQNNSSLGLSEF